MPIILDENLSGGIRWRACMPMSGDGGKAEIPQLRPHVST
jgi:hypothetical protein